MTAREELLDELRPTSFAIAYRMLGSVAEAEDVVQEALIRVHRVLERGEEVQSPHAYVAKVTTRLAIDELRSARARRERYVGDWLPEPIITDSPEDPARQAEMADSLSMAMLVLLESLSPEQRAVLLLHDVFDYSYDEIAEVVEKTQDNVRQLASRARKHIEAGRPRFQTTREQRDELARRFLAAANEGDLAGLEALLSSDAVLTGDGGGVVPALGRSISGRSRVARTLLNWVKAGRRLAGASIRAVEVNAEPGAVLLDGQERVIAVWALEFAEGQVSGIKSVINPQKLSHLGPLVDWTELPQYEAYSRLAKGRTGKTGQVGQGGTGVSLLLIAVGAVIRWAVTAHVNGLSLPTVGLVLIIVGIVGFIVSMLELFMWAPRRLERERATTVYREPTRY